MSGEFYKENRNTSKNYTDRYRRCKILEDLETGEMLLSTIDELIIPSTPYDQYHRVQEHEVGRLDKIAEDYYNNPLLWWVVAQANGYFDPIRKIAPGTLLRIPAIETLYGNNGILL